MYRKDVVALIPTHYRPEYLEMALQAVLEQTLKCDVLIIDSGHHQQTEDVVSKCRKLCTVQKLLHEKIYNVSPANNFYEGFKKACKIYDWVWVMDDDAVADKKALELLFDFSHIPRSIFSSSVFTFYDNEICYHHRRHLKNSSLFREYNSCLEDYKNDYFECDTASYVSVLINSDALVEVNYNNRDFYFQFDDTDLFTRIKKLNYKIINVNQSKVFHGELFKPKKDSYKYSNKELYAIRNHMYLKKIYSENQTLCKIYNICFVFKQLIITLISNKYKNHRHERYNGIMDAYIQANKKVLGKMQDQS